MGNSKKLGAEQQRLAEDAARKSNWKRWGPYLAERQWGTVREDYSADGSSWQYFPFEQSHSRAYRWGEDGLLGFTDREGRLCFAVTLWNGKDRILKERLFGLTNNQGNHGEDVKECYFYLDATPTYSYCKALYKYPQAEFPYARLLEESRRRTRKDPEFELTDTGMFDDSRYFDITVEYAKGSPNDVLIKITVANRGPDQARLHLLPTLWFRNCWRWGCAHEACCAKPSLRLVEPGHVVGEHESLGKCVFHAGPGPGDILPTMLFTDNESNLSELFGVPNQTPFVKDAFNKYVIHGQKEAVNPENVGTKAAALYELDVPAGGEVTMKLRLALEDEEPPRLLARFDRIFADRIKEANRFYDRLLPAKMVADDRNITRQAYAGLLWSKQFYHYVVEDWLEGDANEPRPPASRLEGRNSDWEHLYNRDVISMPDKWEYPWYAAWDLAFHMIPMAHLDPEYAKEQLVLFLREWYMHPNGKIPSYEWNLSDVNPPVHAWACWRVYKIAAHKTSQRDHVFLSRVFHKLLINFTWWVNRKDVHGNHLFSGGFLGLDNVSVFDRSSALPDGAVLEQADGTAWMAFYCGTMLSMALELARCNPAYEDVASKFFEHFVAIADAMNTLGGTGLWDEQDGLYYDHMHVDGQHRQLRIRSLVSLIPLLAVEILDDDVIDQLPGFRKRMDWFLKYRPDLAQHISYLECGSIAEEMPGMDRDGRPASGRRLLAIPSRKRLERVLRYLFDENEFLSPHGVRSLSRFHKEHPYTCDTLGQTRVVDYEPAESRSDLFGGNSNWRGPVWFPVNYLLVEALERYHHYYGDTLKVEFPTGSGRLLSLKEAACELAGRLAKIFQADDAGRRICHGADRRFAEDPHWHGLPLFYEYFHGETGTGLGASHQTGWTALVTRLLEDRYRQK